jgi:TolB protein
MNRTLARISVAALTITAVGARQAPQAPPASQQPSEVSLSITSEGGTPPRFAVPDFIPLSKDAETVSAARRIAEVLWNDLNFEREFALVPRDINATIPAATSMYDVPFDRWREVNADGVIIGTVQKLDNSVRIEVRLFNVRSRASAFGREYSGSIANPRIFAHQISDEIHQQQRALRGVARTKLTFNSDRDGERMAGTIEQRQAKEIYIADYDGENQRRVTTGFSLNINSAWSPDGRSLAYTSYIRGLPNIFVSHIYQGTRDELTKSSGNNTLPAWSPDGTRIAFSSTRDHSGNTEIYVMNADGSNLRRLTNNPAIDTTPTWSPTGTQIAFVSDRRGAPQIWIMSADGLSQSPLTSEYSDRPTWSPAPYNEVAFAARTGPGFDIKILDLATREVHQLTFGEGTNESPAFSPNGRHLAFSSTRSGKSQIFTMSKDGRNVRQVTRNGSNYQPDWSR